MMSTAPDLLTVPQRTPSASAAPLVDMHGRRMGYLRVSVTPHCNFRCVYCRPATGDEGPPADQVLTAEEIVRVCRVAGSLGFAKVRLTGGEPLVRRGIADLVRAVRELPGVDEVAMTTNASLLHVHAASLKAAGLGRVNVSLDTLRRDRAASIARGDVLPAVLNGIDAAVAAGLGPLKFNAVVLRGRNDDELADLVRFAHARGAVTRFIEYMPMGDDRLGPADAVVTADEMRRRLNEHFDLRPEVTSPDAADPARGWRCATTGARVGFITSMSDQFCGTCNRMRLTAEGALRPCLHQDYEVGVRDVLRGGGTDADLAAKFREAAAGKWAGHRMTAFVPVFARRRMVSIGG